MKSLIATRISRRALSPLISVLTLLYYSIEKRRSGYEAIRFLEQIKDRLPLSLKFCPVYVKLMALRDLNHFNPIIEFHRSCEFRALDDALPVAFRNKCRAVIIIAYLRAGRREQVHQLLQLWMPDDAARLAVLAAIAAVGHLSASEISQMYRKLDLKRLTGSQFAVLLSASATSYDDAMFEIKKYEASRRLASAEASLLRASIAWRFARDREAIASQEAFFKYYKINGMPSLLNPQELLQFSEDFPENESKSGSVLVSIIMTVFNTGPLLECAVKSILHQSYTNIELIIVDDCSTDALTRKVLSDLSQIDSRLKILRTKENSGTYVAKNSAIQLAKGDYITFHDSDDWAHPRRIEHHVTAMQFSPTLKATQSQWLRITLQGRPVLKSWGAFVHTNPASLMVSRQVFDDVGLFERVRIGADSEFSSRVRGHYGRRKFKLIQVPLTLGVIRPSALTSHGLGAIGADGFNQARYDYNENWLERHLRADCPTVGRCN